MAAQVRHILKICGFLIILLGYELLGCGDLQARRPNKEALRKVRELSIYPYYSLPSSDAEAQIRLNDYYHFPGLAQSGQSIAERFISFIFPISGKEKRVQFLPYQFWGKKKPQYKEFDWKKIESQHFIFYTYDYDKDSEILNALVRIVESHHDANSWQFSVDNKIKKKIPIILYRSRSDFEQTHAIPILVPETLGGFTEVLSWNRVIFGFEGDKTMFEHVARHEATHIYHVAKRARHLPLWFIEGTAEANSIRWDADAETVIRDAYYNDFLFHIEDLWRISGSWLMYKQGNYVVNFILDNYGEEALRKIFSNSRQLRFEKNVEQALGVSLKELDSKIFAKLNARYGRIGKKKDDVDTAKEVAKGKLLAARGDYFISGRYKDGKFELLLNYLDTKRGVISKRIISDFEIGNESLHVLKSRADLTEKQLIYTIDVGRTDAVRLLDFYYSPKRGRLKLGEPREYKWDDITSILDPVLLGKGRFAFVGFKEGYSGIYIYDTSKDKLTKITTDKSYYRGLDYSLERNILVFSKEGERISKPCRYNYDLYSYNLATKEFTKLTDTEYSEVSPAISPDGSKIAFVGNKDDVHNLFLYDLDNGKVVQATDVKVAAFTPRWRDNQKLYFGTIRKFESFIYRMMVPTLKIAFSRSLPPATEKFYSLENNKIVLAEEVKKEEVEDVLVGAEFKIKENSLFVIDDTRDYKVKNFVAKRDGFLMITGAQDTEWKQNEKTVLFSYGAGKLRRLTKNFGFKGRLDPTVWDIVKAFKKDKSVIDMWVSPDAMNIFILVNNRLSFEKKKAAQSLYRIDVAEAKIEELPYYKALSGLKDNIVFIYFLQNSKSLIRVQRRDWEGKEYTQYYLYDGVKKKYRKMYVNIPWLDVSRDSRYLLTVPSPSWGEGNVSIYDSLKDEKRVVYKAGNEFAVVGAHFVEGNGIFLGLKEKSGGFVSLKFVNLYGEVQFEKRLGITSGYRLNFAVASLSGQNVALRIKNLRTKTGVEKLYFYHRGEDILKEIGTDLSYYRSIMFGDEVLIFEGKDLDDFKNLYSFENGVTTKGYAVDQSDYSDTTRRLVVGGGEEILSVDVETGQVKKIMDKAFGFDVFGDTLVFSSFTEGYYNLFLYDLAEDKLRRLSKSWFNELSPKISAGGLAYTVDEEKRFSIHLRPNIGKDEIERIYLEKSNVYNPLWKTGKLYFNVASMGKEDDRQIVPRDEKQGIWSTSPLETSLKPGKVVSGMRPQYIYGGVAYDGDSAVIFISLTADNIFSDRGIFVNTLYKSDFINSTVGYTNLEKGRTYTFYVNKLDDDKSGGLSFMKTYLIDKFREFDLYTQMEYQGFTPDEFKGDLVESPGQGVTQYVIKSGAVYAIDTSVWDMHGPMKGARLMGKAELGINVRTGKFSNVDGNLDIRLYNLLVRRVGFAHRFMAGTSRGNFPTVYFLGGNMSFRGVPFDGLEGNNYWVFSEDLRIPLFDVLGAKLPDPVDYALGPFFRFFDVRGGLYLDMGQIWFNKRDNPDNLLYSFGFFINSPTIFGMTLRFSKGILGESGFNFWFGANW